MIPRTIFVDQLAELTVVLVVDRPTKIDYVDVKVRGHQGWLISTGKASSGFRRDVPSLHQQVAGEGELAPGEHRYPVRFTLPVGTAPTHELRPAFSKLLIDVHASIPWWPDGRYTFEAPVRIAPPAEIERRPLLTRHPFAATGNEPRIELSLGSSTLVAGEALVGSVALFHMSDDKPRVVTFSFEPLLALHGYGKPWPRMGPGYQSEVTIPAGGASEAVPFRVGLPLAMTSSFQSLTHDVSWVLTVSVGSFFAGKLKLQVPLTIVDARGAAQVAPLTLAPRVADQRVLASFERLAEQTGMRVLESDSHSDELPAVARDVGETQVRLGYAYRGTEGTFLVGRIAYRSLGLGLSVTPSSGWREAVTRDIEVDVAEWDRHHHVEARSPQQAIPFLRGALPGAASGELVRWTDDELVTERSIGTLEDAELARMAASLVALAEAINSACGSIRPPPGLDVDEPAWLDAAQRLRGQVSFGDLSIDGTLDMQPVAIGLVFDERGQPTVMRVSVGAPKQDVSLVSSDRLRELLWDVGQALPDVTYNEGVASASLAVAAGGTDAARVRDVARTLRNLLAALEQTDGPYR